MSIRATTSQRAAGTLTFAATETTRTISVLVVGDTQIEFDETFQVKLWSPNGAVLGRSKGRGLIVDDGRGS